MKNRSQKTLTLKNTVKTNIGIAESTGLDVYGSDLMYLAEEGEQSQFRVAEVLLVHLRLQPDNRQVFIVKSVAARDEDFMA